MTETYSRTCEKDGEPDYWNEAEREWYRRDNNGGYVTHTH